MRWPVAPDWPHAEQSQRIYSAPHRWHIQQMGQGPLILLLHGVGGSTHSFAGLMQILAKTHSVIACDLPGHGYTQLGARHRSGLDHVSEDIANLCVQEGWKPDAIVGHSAGCAVALRLAQTLASPRGQTPKVIGLNAALDSFDGIAGALFPVLAKALATLPFTARVFSGIAGNSARVQSLIGSTGSKLEAAELSRYISLVADKDHVDGALLMMAQWSLDGLLSDLPDVSNCCLLITAQNDATVPERVSQTAAKRLLNASHLSLPDLGHLAHEEDPALIAHHITRFLDHSDS